VNPHLALLLSAAYPRGLAPEHLADLRKSTITDETIRAQHIMSVPPAMFGRLLGFDVPDVRSMMLLPFLASGAGFIGHVRVKIFPELKGKDCHSTKYLQPRGSSPRLYFVTCCMDSVLRGDGPVWFVEGEKKALSVGQLGLSAVGFSGAEGWHRSGAKRGSFQNLRSPPASDARSRGNSGEDRSSVRRSCASAPTPTTGRRYCRWPCCSASAWRPSSHP